MKNYYKTKSGKYIAQKTFRGVRQYIGSYNTECEAICAVKEVVSLENEWVIVEQKVKEIEEENEREREFRKMRSETYFKYKDDLEERKLGLKNKIERLKKQWGAYDRGEIYSTLDLKILELTEECIQEDIIRVESYTKIFKLWETAIIDGNRKSLILILKYKNERLKEEIKEKIEGTPAKKELKACIEESIQQMKAEQ